MKTHNILPVAHREKTTHFFSPEHALSERERETKMGRRRLGLAQCATYTVWNAQAIHTNAKTILNEAEKTHTYTQHRNYKNRYYCRKRWLFVCAGCFCFRDAIWFVVRSFASAFISFSIRCVRFYSLLFFSQLFHDRF